MCGIFGFIKAKSSASSKEVCIEGLKSLEYRGYDSAGIAGIHDSRVHRYRSVGKVKNLEDSLINNSLELEVAIAHTRWATHGTVTQNNTHPHLDQANSIALVHNGIIENHQKIKARLEKKGVKFLSETDSEVICQLVSDYYEDSLTEALKKASQELEGSFAVAAIHKSKGSEIVAMSHKSPLVVAIDKKTMACYISSDITPFANRDLEILFLENYQIATITPEKTTLCSIDGALLKKKWTRITQEGFGVDKMGYEHFMLKEIHEQPEMVRRNLNKQIDLEKLRSQALNFDQIIFVGCGSSYHAALVCLQEFERASQKICRAFIASEFNYNLPKVGPKSLLIVLSQSGETADLLAVVKNLSGLCPILAITNARHSSLVRMTQQHLFLEAGIEVSVCSTKAFSSQVLNLLLLNQYLYKKPLDHTKLVQALHDILDRKNEIQKLAIKYSVFKNFSFIGRGNLVASCHEAALKLKEISYLAASAYPAGEMKHGPIALIDENHPTIALLQDSALFEKTLSNLSEIKARMGPVLVFTTKHAIDIADDSFVFSSCGSEQLDTILFAQALQLFAYYIAKELGTNIDQPKNLAKSVTVE
jgi:glutamine---fructose-6-phosphate transaminase (isomerizing)